MGLRVWSSIYGLEGAEVCEVGLAFSPPRGARCPVGGGGVLVVGSWVNGVGLPNVGPGGVAVVVVHRSAAAVLRRRVALCVFVFFSFRFLTVLFFSPYLVAPRLLCCGALGRCCSPAVCGGCRL